jgi:hypothetical protein
VTAALWIALLTGHVAWSVHLLASYLLATAGCAVDPGGLPLARHATTIVAAAATAGAAAFGARTAAVEAAGERRYAALLALALNATFLFAILLAGAAGLLVRPCV